MAEKKLNIKVSTTGAAKAKQEVGGLNGAISKMGKAVGIASAAYFGARGLISGFSTVIRLAGEQEKAEAKLNAVIKSTGGAAGLTANELTKMASSLQAVTTFGDETIISAQSLLLTFTKIGEEVFPQATETILNMAVAMETDLKSATVQLGKALNDPITGISALSRVGVQLTDTQKGQIKSFTELGDIASAQKVILGELETQFGGLARATADTMAGSMEQASMAVGDLGESLGTLLSPAVISASGAIKDISNDLIDFIDILNHNKSANTLYYEEVEKTEAILEKFSDSLGIVIDPALSLTDQLEFLRSKAKELNDGEFFQGVAFSNTAKALEESRGQVERLEIALNNFKATALEMPERPVFNFLDDEEIDILPDVIINMQEMNDLMNEAFGIQTKLKKSTDEVGYSWDTYNKNLDTAVAGSIATASSLSSVTDALGTAKIAAKQASISFVSGEIQKAVASYIQKFLMTTPLPPIVSGPLAIAGGAAFGSAMSSAIARNFADGGIVPGSGDRDTVPAMLTPGEVILNQAQQSNLVGGMGGVTVNIQGNVIGNQEFVRDILIPEIKKGINFA